MRYKSIFVAAKAATYSEEVLFSGTVTKESDVFIDGEDLARQCEAACNRLDGEGYEVITITETTRGSYFRLNGAMPAWSMTLGLVITARLKG